MDYETTNECGGLTADEWMRKLERRGGKLYFRRRGPGNRKGDEAGTLNKHGGFWQVRGATDRTCARARVIWLLTRGKLPASEREKKTHVIIHLDGDDLNDDPLNLACKQMSCLLGNPAHREISRRNMARLHARLKRNYRLYRRWHAEMVMGRWGRLPTPEETKKIWRKKCNFHRKNTA